MSPVGSQKLPPQTLKPHSTTFPRVTKIICAVQDMRLGPGIAQAFPTRRAREGSWGGGFPRPTALSSLRTGHVFPSPRTEGEARNRNSCRELNAGILKLPLFYL